MPRPGVPAFGAALLAATLILASAAPALAQGRPEVDRIPGTGVVDFPAGEVCDFDLRWEFSDADLTSIVFPVQPDGDQLQRLAGFSTTTAINLETGASLTFNTSTRLDFLFRADGLIEVSAAGRVATAYYPTDLGGRGHYLFVGHLEDLVDGSFTLLAHDFSGRMTELCSALD